MLLNACTFDREGIVLGHWSLLAWGERESKSFRTEGSQLTGEETPREGVFFFFFLMHCAATLPPSIQPGTWIQSLWELHWGKCIEIVREVASPRKSLIKKTGAKIRTLSENCKVIPEERIPTEPPPLLSTLGDSQQKWLQVAFPDFCLRSLKAVRVSSWGGVASG